MYQEKKRERRRRDAARAKAAVLRYGWVVSRGDGPSLTPRTIGILARTHHTCSQCGCNRAWFGPSFAERRRRLIGT
jgi:hypothetical protein